MTKKSEKNIKFEEALEKLEDIVDKLEEGDLPLDESMKLFEEGVKLTRVCAKRLDDAEKKIKMLVKDEESLSLKNFEEE